MKILILGKSYIFGILYFPPEHATEVGENLRVHLINAVLGIYEAYSPYSILLAGDFNRLDTYDITLHTTLNLVFDGPTRKQAALDKIFCNLDMQVHSAKSLVSSDHLALIGTIACKIPVEKRFVEIRDQRHSNKLELGSLLRSADFSALYAEDDPNEKTTQLTSILQVCLNLCCPKKKVQITSRDPPYMSPLVKILCRKKNCLIRKGRLKEAEMVSLRIKSAIYQNCSSKRGRANTKEWWNYIRHHTGRSSKGSHWQLFNASDFNKYYSKVCRTDNYQKPSVPNINECDYPEFNILEVYSVLRQQKRSAPGIDGLPHWIYSEFAEFIAEPLTNIVNACIRKGVFPNCLKLSKVIPLPKTNNPDKVSDYRPVSLTPIISRIIERLLYNKFLKPIYANNLSKRQHGFRPQGSTSNTLIAVQNHIANFQQLGYNYVRVFSLDLSKAFDKLPHNIILTAYSTLEPHLHPNVLSVIMDFHFGRSQLVEYKGEKSDIETTNCGCPQGGVNSPVSYNLSVRELDVFCYVQSELEGFADDNYVVCAGFYDKTSKLFLDHAEIEIQFVKDFFSRKGLILNEAKSKEIIIKFDNVGKLVNLKPVIGIPQVSEFKALGILVDDKISFEAHIDSIVKRTASNLFLLLRLKRLGFSKRELWVLYNALVVSVFTYGITVWGAATNSKLLKIDRIQKRAVRHGIIDAFEPILSILKNRDDHLFQQISRYDQHPLRRFIPERELYAEQHLRQRRPPVGSLKKEWQLSIFPHRYLRTFSC